VTRVRKWLLGVLGVLLLAIIGAVGTAWWAIATESGSRWLVTRAVEYTPLDMQLSGIAGTLRHGLRVEYFEYVDADRRIRLADLDLELDWSRTNTGQLWISRLAAQRLDVVSLSEPEPKTGPLNLDVPALPLRIVADSIALQVADYDGVVIRRIEVLDVATDGLDVAIGSARAAIDEFELQLRELGARLADEVPLATAFAWQATDNRWSGTGAVRGSLHGVDIEHDLAGEYALRSVGNIELLNIGEPAFDIVSTFEQWQYEQWVASAGQVRLIGSLNDFRSELSVGVTDGELLSAELSGELAGNDSGFTSIDLRVNTFDGRARVTGSARWSPTLQANLSLTGSALDLSAFTGGFATRLEMQLDLTATDVEQFTINVGNLAGSYSEQPIRITGTLSRDGEEWRCTSCDAAVGANRVQADLMLNDRRISGAIDVVAPAIEQLHPDFSGMLQAQGTLSGSPRLPILSGNITARDLFANDMPIGSGDIQVTGDLNDIDVTTRWTLQGNSIDLSAQLQREEDRIAGRLSRASIDQKETGTWTLADPVNFSIDPELVTVGESLWSNGDARLRTGQLVRSATTVAADIELTGASMRWLAAYLPDEVAIDGYADVALNLRQDNGDWSGSAEWRQLETVLHVKLIDGEVFEVAVPAATAQARLEPTGATLGARVEADGGVAIDLSGTASELSRDAIIDAQLNARGEEFGWVAAFIPEVDEVAGSVAADFTVQGRADDPQLRGELRLIDGSVVLPAFNVPVTNIEARLTATSSDSLAVVGEARAGEGSLAIAGSITDAISPNPSFEVTFRGQDATVLDWPDYVLVASPDLSLSGKGNEFEVDGRVRMDRAEIHVRELPEGAVKPSADVSVVGREEADTRESRLRGAIEIELSDQVHVRAFGLDTNLEGVKWFGRGSWVCP
jgi:translocation and assembly module TamB